MAVSYLVQEDGTSHIELEDLSGFILLEESGSPAPPIQAPQGGFAVSVRRPRARLIVPDDDELIALTIAARMIRRRRLS